MHQYHQINISTAFHFERILLTFTALVQDYKIKTFKKLRNLILRFLINFDGSWFPIPFPLKCEHNWSCLWLWLAGGCMNYTYLPSNWPGNVNIVVLNIDGGNVLCLCEYYSIIINNNLMGRFTQIQESQMFPTSIMFQAKVSTETRFVATKLLAIINHRQLCYKICINN